MHDDTMRLLHTMLRVGDLQRSIRFYTEVMGMQLLRTTQRPEQKYDLAFLGYGRNPEHAEIELTYNHGVDRYDLGTAYGHIAIGVPDVAAACAAVREKAAALGGAQPGQRVLAGQVQRGVGRPGGRLHGGRGQVSQEHESQSERQRLNHGYSS